MYPFVYYKSKKYFDIASLQTKRFTTNVVSLQNK
jgi:hypothetical protein